MSKQSLPPEKLWTAVGVPLVLLTYFFVKNHLTQPENIDQAPKEKTESVEVSSPPQISAPGDTTENPISYETLSAPPRQLSNPPQNTGSLEENEQVHYLRVRARAKPRSTSVSKHSFPIPDNWQVSNTEIIQQQGRVRSYVKNGHVFVEAHALPLELGQRGEDAFAVLKITIQQK